MQSMNSMSSMTRVNCVVTKGETEVRTDIKWVLLSLRRRGREGGEGANYLLELPLIYRRFNISLFAQNIPDRYNCLEL